MARCRQYVFNEVAALYDEVRPGYPPAIVDAAVALAALPSGGRILEIGCGTGQITLPFAMRGYSILALEPGDVLLTSGPLTGERLLPPDTAAWLAPPG